MGFQTEDQDQMEDTVILTQILFHQIQIQGINYKWQVRNRIFD